MTSEQLSVVGVNFRKTSLEIRSKFAFTSEQSKSIYKEATDTMGGNFFILSTCNRTEIYSIGVPDTLLIELLSKHSGFSLMETHQYAFVKSGDSAVRHLLRVASGLDSQILGDYEIIGQLKKAFALAKDCAMANGFLEKLVNTALQASKQVKSKTSISNGTTSVSYAVIQLLKLAADIDPASICLVGLGKIGMLTLKNLKHYLPQNKITLVNRDESKAEIAALVQDVTYAPFEDLNCTLAKSNVLIVATGANHAIVCKKDIEQTGIKLIFDLAVPSNVHPDVREIGGVRLYNIDQLSQIVNQSTEARKSEVPLAESIIEQQMYEFKEWEIRRSLYTTKSNLPPVEISSTNTFPAY